MLNQYTNTNKFNTSGADSCYRLSNIQDDLLNKKLISVGADMYDLTYELHIYSNDTWITGNHNITSIESNNRSNHTFITANIFDEFNNLKLTSGRFRFLINFFKNIIGSYDSPSLYINEISPDRTELKLKLINKLNLKQYTDFAKQIKDQPVTSTVNYNQYILNFSRNKTIAVVNLVIVGEFLYVKLLNALPDDITENFKCWLDLEYKLPYTDLISLYIHSTKKTFNTLTGVNWDANVKYLNISSQTEVKNWNDLLGSTTGISQQLIDHYFSGSLSGIPLNIDYRDFNNFIFYSSAEERLRNFKFKLDLLEYYNSQITILGGISGSTATTNIQDYELNKNNIIGNFDSFEKYLYYESSSLLTNNDIPVLDANVSNLTGSYCFPAPKSNSTLPYNLYSTTSSIFIDWYNSLIYTASYYDSLNINKLTNSLPDYIKYDELNDNLISFVNMLAHHYDIIHSYIKQSSNIYKHEENPKIGVPNDLLPHIAQQFGWTLVEGNQYSDLWQYILGTDESGIPLTGSLTVGDPSVAGKNMTAHVWRRIVNNLPYILKSKGTKRSVTALLACYGIPETMISINEYGGPRLDRVPIYEKLNFDYALDLITNPAGTVTINYTQPIEAFELRFRTEDITTNPTLPSIMNLATIGSNIITLNYVSGNKGTVNINGNATSEIEIYDNNWLSILLQKNGTNLDLFVNKSKYGKILSTVSASVTSSFNITSSVVLGSTTSGSRLIGQLQELRLWTSSLNLELFNNHTKAPSAYNANVSAYDELVFRLPLTQKINHTLTSSLSGIQPKSNNISASFSSWTNSTPYDSIEELYYFDSLTVGGSINDDNKVRIESNSISGSTLHLLSKSEVSEFDTAPLDSNKIGIYFSPQTIINEDIIAQLGFTELDSIIGDPGDTDKYSYPKLIQTSQNYWKKYSEKNNFNLYNQIFSLYDLSVFNQINQVLPARVEKLTGVLIQPNLLERNKTSILPTVEKFYDDLEVKLSLSETTNLLNSDYIVYEGNITSSSDTNIISDYNEMLQFNLTSSTDIKFDNVQYSKKYLIHSGSTYITGSTPYWMSDYILPTFMNSVLSELVYKTEIYYYNNTKYTISSSAEVTDFLPKFWYNLKYNGCKMSSPGFNLKSTDTVDGAPVVEIKEVNPAQIVLNSVVGGSNFNNFNPVTD